ncbi:hypothetical protein PJIAN_3623 [Paludibacter jiangxiensis]|uniref:Uncharacterized protein n=1 Tax=Paludibacter jiangxiensis TaxID=681398 RepID=A0A161LEU2_9BACT|nr:hypothetical protein PJIAN_3623 [Paludibacter jiangxiensis]
MYIKQLEKKLFNNKLQHGNAVFRSSNLGKNRHSLKLRARLLLFYKPSASLHLFQVYLMFCADYHFILCSFER